MHTVQLVRWESPGKDHVSLSLQNSSLLQANETAESDSMRLNPHIQYYSRVYVLSMGAALFLKTVRGLVFVKVIWSLFVSVRDSSVQASCLHYTQLNFLSNTWVLRQMHFLFAHALFITA